VKFECKILYENKIVMCQDGQLWLKTIRIIVTVANKTFKIQIYIAFSFTVPPWCSVSTAETSNIES
jgi:hypothetical protein